MRKTAFILLLLLTAASCERTFELKEGTLRNKLYLDCVAGAGDSTFVTVQTCIPVNGGKAVKTVRTEIESMTLTIGGAPAPLTRDSRPGQKYNRWYTLAPVADGQEISVEVKAKGMEKASGSSVVLAAPVIKSISMVPCSKDTTMFDVHLELEGDYLEGALYGFSCQLRQEGKQIDVGIDTVSINSVLPLTISDVLASDSLNVEESQLFDLTFDGTTLIDNFSLMALFTPTSEEGLMHVFIPRQKYFRQHGHKFHFYVPRSVSDSLSYRQAARMEFIPEFHMIPEHDVISDTRSFYKWKVIRLSEDFFYYTQARWMQRTNPLSFVGLAPAMAAWSNVSGGFGVVAGCRIAETPWQESVRPGLFHTHP